MTKARAHTSATLRTAGCAVTLAIALLVLGGCSREKIDWKSAEAADTVEAYDHFLARHAEGELATQARTRIAQLNEDRAWKRASAADTADAYRQFLAQHENGKWAEEARIRLENFALDGSGMSPAGPAAGAAATETPPVDAAARAATAPPTSVTASAPQPGTFGPRADAPPAAPTASAQPAARPGTAATDASRPAASATTNSARPAGSAVSPPGAGATAPSGQFGIQLGAFRSQDAALKDWKRLQVKFDSDLHGLFARAVPVQQSGGQLFRLQAPVGEEARARAICASLAKQSQPCVVVLPPH